jgi:DNA-binding GntR family transcriptional regulator
MAVTRRNRLNRARLSDQICAKILERWRCGRLQPGQRLDEITVAAEYGVSRTPVREAMFQLAQHGILVESGRGYVLRVDDPAEVVQQLEVRSLLEPAMARHAAVDGTAAQIAQLEKILRQEAAAAAAGRIDAFLDFTYRFRRQLREMCSNEILAGILERVEDQFTAWRIVAFRDEANRRFVVTQHQALVEAIKARSPEAAASAMQQYLERIRSHYAGARISRSEAPEGSAMAVVAGN